MARPIRVPERKPFCPVRKVTTLALSFDHRIVDGDLGSAVLRDIGAMLEDPLRMLAWS